MIGEKRVVVVFIVSDQRPHLLLDQVRSASDLGSLRNGQFVLDDIPEPNLMKDSILWPATNNNQSQ